MAIDKSSNIIPLGEVKSLLLDLMSTLDSFCREKGLRYSLAYGSLIGAIRHKGFIPWDDDIDVLMPREDYLRLISEFDAPFYKIYCQEKDCEYPITFAKLCDTRTLSIDHFGNKSPIAIDIFILDGMGASLEEANKRLRKVKRMYRVWSNQLFSRRLTLRKDYGFLKNCYILFAKIVSPFFRVDKIVKKTLSLKRSLPLEESKYCAYLGGMFTVYETEKMLDYTDTLFEDRLFRIPVEYDYQLRLVYGDYMKLPPMEQRVETHQATAYWVK